MMDSKDEIEYPLDFVGQEVHPGDYVLGASGHALCIYRVVRLTPRMVRIVSITAKSVQGKKGVLRYADELFKIDEQMVTFYLMKL